ncbi:MAG: hypothetical protein ONB51_04660 [candidate division KSB1 bacterium]|nr:hypothetical protein [candidate division KSB1 bacterium]
MSSLPPIVLQLSGDGGTVTASCLERCAKIARLAGKVKAGEGGERSSEQLP